MNQWNEQRQQEFETLLTGLLEGETDSQTRGAINAIMREHREARDLYLSMMALHTELHACHSESESAASGHRPQPGSARSRWERNKQLILRPTPLSIGIAAVSVTAMLAFLAAIAPPAYRAVRGRADSDAYQTEAALARVTGLHEAQFESSRLRRGSHLRASDSLQLASGLLELRCTTGEQLIVQGPCVLKFDPFASDATCASVFLASGRLTASVPEPAIGFTVRTPSATIVDRGTEFGVMVCESQTEVHVIEGNVEAKSHNAVELTVVGAGEAYRFSNDSPTPESIEIASTEFTREIPGQATSRDPYAAAVLRDRPAGYWRLNDRGSNLAVNSAGRPYGMYRGNVKLAGEARPGSATYEEYCRSAHFDGVDDFAEVAYDERFHGEDFTVEAWVKLDHVPRDHGSVVTSRQAPQRTAGYAIYISPEGQWEFWTGNNGDWSVLEGSSADVGRWTHIAATFQRIRSHPDGRLSGIARLYVDAQLVGHATGHVYVPLREFSRPLRIGAGATESRTPGYFFPGRIADVSIYGRSLSQDAIVAHFASTTQREEE